MRVLQSFPANRPTTNPYLLQLSEGLQQHAAVEGFGWRRALTARYDVVHLHWPEAMLHGSTPARSLARRVLVRALLLRLRLTRTAVVRTLHNVRSHETVPRSEQKLLDRIDRRTDLWIRLNAATPVLPASLVRTIPHGHYRAWYAGYRDTGPVAGRLLFFGLIRPYKGVETLVSVFRETAALPGNQELSLHIVGRPYSPAIAEDLRDRVGDDTRIALRLGHASDAELAEEIHASTLVVLPYREMHNSGAALLALSLDRPVLVPANAVTQALRDEVGGEWVQTYAGELSAAAVTEALERVRGIQQAPPPDLTARDWDGIASAHVAAYEAAIERRRSRHRRRRVSARY